jgi:hypothetical protein
MVFPAGRPEPPGVNDENDPGPRISWLLPQINPENTILEQENDGIQPWRF